MLSRIVRHALLLSGLAWRAASFWSPSSAPSSLMWYSAAASRSGENMTAAVYEGAIYTSHNYGSSFAVSGASTQVWTSVATNSSGQMILASAYQGNGGQPGIYLSEDYGATFRLVNSQSNTNGVSCDCSGRIILAVQLQGVAKLSTNRGGSWSQPSSLPTNAVWFGSYVSCTGQVLAAAVQTDPNKGIYVSTDGGSSWASKLTTVSGITSIAGSSGGSVLVACAYQGSIYLSPDSGTTWAATAAPSGLKWQTAASDATGQYLAAGVNPGPIYNSLDGGVTWQTMYTAGSRQWRSIACSDSGDWCVAAAQGGGVFVGSVTSLDAPPTAAPTYSLRPTQAPTPLPTSSAPTMAPVVGIGGDSTNLYLALLVVGISIILSVCALFFYTGYMRFRFFLRYSRPDAEDEPRTAEARVVHEHGAVFEMLPVSLDVIVLQGDEEFVDDADLGAAEEEGEAGPGDGSAATAAAAPDSGAQADSAGSNSASVRNTRSSRVISVVAEEHHVAQAFRLD